jgi:hypothetical protein
MCLGLVPTLGGPERPLHWAMTAGMIGFGALLWTRRRLRGSEPPLQPVPRRSAVLAGRAVLAVTGVVAGLVALIAGTRLAHGGSLGALSLAMPGLGLAWLTLLGVQSLRHREPAAEPAPAAERSSRRPAKRDGRSNRSSSHPRPPNPHLSA